MTSKSDPHLEGAIAYHEYESRDSNPYESGTMDYLCWDAGYSAAKNGFVDERGWPTVEYDTTY